MMEFTELYNNYHRQIAARAYRLTHDYYKAEDVTQETFLKAWKYWPPSDMDHLYGWLSTICIRLCHDLYRHERVRPSAELTEAVLQHRIYEPIEALPEHWQRVEAFNALPATDRCLLYRLATGESIRDFSRREGHSEERTYVRQRGARDKLWRRYTTYEQGEAS